MNNPVNSTDPSGELDVTATVAGSAIGFILRELGKALLGLKAGYLIAELVNNPPTSPSISIPENTKPETDEKEKDITIPPKNGRIIEWRDPIAKRKYSNGMKILIMVYIIIQCWLSGMESITICTIFRVLQCRNHGIQCIWEVNYGNRCIKWQNY